VPASAERPLSQLLDALSDAPPAPAGGSAAAWSAALGAALLEMVAGLAGEEEPASAPTVLRARLVELGEQELHSYAPVLAAMRLPAGDPTRDRELAASLSSAADAPLAIASAAAEVAELSAAVATRSRPAVKGEAIAGVLLAEAESRAAGRLVEINLAGGNDDRLAEVEELGRRAAAARDAALAMA